MNEKMPTQFPWGLHSTGNCRQKKCHPSFSPEINNTNYNTDTCITTQNNTPYFIW